MPRKSISVLAALIAAALSVAAITSLAVAAGRAPSAHPARGGAARIELHRTGRGKLLTDGRGYTVYAFGLDRRRRDRCAAIPECTKVWPIIATHGRPRAGAGVKRSLLGTIRVHGITQVTYAGHPLYGYVADHKPGATGYVGFSGFGGLWMGVRASGALVR